MRGCMVCVVMALGLAEAAAQAPSKAAIEWLDDLAGARKVAIEQQKPMIIVFAADGCRHCERLAATTLQHPSITTRVAEKYVAVQVDGAKYESITRNLGLRVYPSILLVDPQGDAMGVVQGFCDANKLANELQLAQIRAARKLAQQTPRSQQPAR